jgi:hypothetical protein
MKKLLLLMLIVAINVMSANFVNAQTGPVDIKKVPTYLNSTNAGTEFYVTVPPAYVESWNPNDGWSLYIACGTRTQVTVENEAAGTKRQFQTKPNDCIRVILSGNEVQAYVNTSGSATGHPPETVYPGAGLRITSKAPIVVYVCVKISYTSDAYLAIPTSGWGREYVVNTYQAHNWTMPARNLASMCTILAAYDNTKVFFTMVGNGITQTMGGLKIGQTKQFMMNKGDVVAVASSVIVGSTLAGSRIVASKPVGVVSGVQCADVPSDRPWCDHIIEMELPVNTWGTTYHMTKNFNRAAGPFFQLFAKEPNTKVFVNGANIAFLGTKPQTSVADWGEYNQYGTQWSGANGNFVVSADKPISMTMFNQGQSLDNVVNDPYQIVYSPMEQYQNQIIFSTPGVGDGAGFSQNYLNIVYSLDDNNAMPDHLEWGQLEGSVINWTKFKDRWGSGPSHIYPGTQEGKKWAVKNISLPGDGVYHVRCKEKFACYSYGMSSYDSYGFPTSVALYDLSIPDTVNPDPRWLQLCNGDVVGPTGTGPATVTDMPDDATIRSNLAFVWRDDINSVNYEFEYVDFVPGEDRTTTWTAYVPDKSKDGRLVLNFVDRRGNDTTIQIIYTSPNTELSPKQLDFGFIKSGDNKTMRFYIVNTSTAEKVVERVEMKIGGQGFTFVNLQLPVTIPSMDSVGVDVIFNATVDGQFKDSVGFDICGEMVYFTELIAGVGNPQILAGLTPNLECDAQFNQVTVGEPATRNVRVSNPGNYPLTITGASALTNAEFTTNLGVGALSYPIVINPQEFINFTVTFTPTATIPYTDQIVFESDATTPDPIATICGQGIQASLTITGFDWQERRIDRPADRREYKDGFITLDNKGTQGVLVSALSAGDVNFEINPNNSVAYPINVGPGEQRTVPVTFSPKTVGPHTLQVTASSNIGDRTATLEGIGIVPVATMTPLVNFGKTVVAGDPTTFTTMDVQITNTIYDYDDVLTITDLTQVVPGSVQEVFANPDDWDATTQGFRYDKNGLLNTPIVLPPGESRQFEVRFYSANPGAKTATVRTVSDAETEVTSNWIGQVTQTLTSDIAVVGGAVGPICINSNGTITATITSTGQTPLNITNIALVNNATGYFTITTPLNLPLNIPVGETRTIDIAYAPVVAGNHVATLEVTSDAVSGAVASQPITGVAQSFTRNFTVVGPQNSVEIGTNITVPIRLDAGANILLADVKQVQFTLNYQDANGAKILSTVAGNIVLNPALAAEWDLVNTNVDAANGIATFTLQSKGPASLNSVAGTEIATIQFLTTLDRAVQNVELRLNAVAVGNTCVVLTTTPGAVTLNPTCALAYRGVMGSGVSFGLSSVNPNPVSSGNANIDFSVGFTAPTEIVVFNSQGQIVATAVRQTLQPGHYTVSVPVDALTSGAYYYKMTSGTFTETKELVIQK